MIGTYGIAKIDVAAITDANVQYLRDTDLGLTLRNFTSESVIPAKGETATINTIVAGSGYTLTKDGLPKEGILCSATGGSGTGAQFMITSVEDQGLLNVGSSIQPTAKFQEYQNSLYRAFDYNSPNPYTYARVTATGLPLTATSAAVLGASSTGAAGTFIVTVTNGLITNVTIAAPGAGYKVGDIVTITKATLEAAGAFGGGNVFLSDLNILLTEANITGGINANADITVVNGGSGYTIGDTLTLQEVGSDNVGTGTVDVLTLGTALNTTGTILSYPTGIMNTGGTAGAITVKDTVGNTVVLGAMQPGVIRKFAFSQVLGAGTGPAVGEVTILY